MQDRANMESTTGNGQPCAPAQWHVPVLACFCVRWCLLRWPLRRAWLPAPVRCAPGVRCVTAAAVLAIRLLVHDSGALELVTPLPEPLKELLDSAGPMIIAAGLDGRFTYVNPALNGCWATTPLS